jgi:hypothetical protein
METPADSAPKTIPVVVATPSLAAITRHRRGVVRNVSVAVPWRYSPAEMMMPSASTKMAPLAATFRTARMPRSDSRFTAALSAPTTTALATASALTATVAASSAQVVLVVRSFRNSAARSAVMAAPPFR